MDVKMSRSPPSDPSKEPRALRSLVGRPDGADRFAHSDPRCHAPEAA